MVEFKILAGAASAVGIATPVAYKLRRRGGHGGEVASRGRNFAGGGSGVLDTGYFQRNISSQIDLFQKQLRGCGPTGVALVVVSGNDYSAVVDKNNATSVSCNCNTTTPAISIYISYLLSEHACMNRRRRSRTSRRW